jgi:3-oxoisoapionate decarboxylase
MSGQRPSRPRVGIDNYGLLPLGLGPLGTLRWAAGHGADGVAFSGLTPKEQAALDGPALAELAAFAHDHSLYLEWGGAGHIPRDMTSWARKDLFDVNRRAAEQASALDARVVRSCSGGLMRWDPEAPPTETLLAETAAALAAQRSMLRDHGVILAIETHFEFTSHELVRLLERLEAEPGDWLGVCLDTMNLLTMLEEPVAATRRLLPWVVSTHIKDGGLLLGAAGLTTFTAPVGVGIIDLPRIVALVASLDRDVRLSIEDHGGSFDLPVFDPLFLSKFPDLTATEFAALVALAGRTAESPACRPLPRERWPGLCDARVAGDLAALKSIVEGWASRHEPR